MLYRPFHQLQSPKVEVFLTGDRGWGVKAAEPIAKGSFVVEYAGEIMHIPCLTCLKYPNSPDLTSVVVLLPEDKFGLS